MRAACLATTPPQATGAASLRKAVRESCRPASYTAYHHHTLGVYRPPRPAKILLRLVFHSGENNNTKATRRLRAQNTQVTMVVRPAHITVLYNSFHLLITPNQLGRLTHIAFDAVLISAFLAGVKRSTGLTYVPFFLQPPQPQPQHHTSPRDLLRTQDLKMWRREKKTN